MTGWILGRMVGWMVGWFFLGTASLICIALVIITSMHGAVRSLVAQVLNAETPC